MPGQMPALTPAVFQVSVPPLFYPPWKKDLGRTQSESEISLAEEDRRFLRESNATGVFAHARCSVSGRRCAFEIGERMLSK